MTNIINDVKFRLAEEEDLNDINILFKEVVDDMGNNKKLDMWNDFYLFCEFEKDINNKEMYVILNDSKIIGSFCLSDYDDPENQLINWTLNKRFVYLNRLAILPSEQGKGYAKAAMKYINDYAVENKYEVLRLTVYEKNKDAIILYEKDGFVKIENCELEIYGKIFLGFEKQTI